MDAAVVVGPDLVETRRVATPTVSGPGQLVIRNLVSTICGSDVHVLRHAVAGEPHRPGYPGHESVGVVVETSDTAVPSASSYWRCRI